MSLLLWALVISTASPETDAIQSLASESESLQASDQEHRNGTRLAEPEAGSAPRSSPAVEPSTKGRQGPPRRAKRRRGTEKLPREDRILIRRLGKVEYHDGAYLAPTAGYSWRELSELTRTGDAEDETPLLARLEDRPIMLTTRERLSRTARHELPEGAEVTLEFVPELPSEIAGCMEFWIEPTHPMADLGTYAVTGLRPPFTWERVHDSHSWQLDEATTISGLHSGVQYRLETESSCENTHGSLISAEPVEFTPPAELRVFWKKARGVEFILDGCEGCELNLVVHRTRKGGGSFVLGRTQDGKAWLGTSSIRDGTYEVSGTDGPWRATEPRQRFSVTDGVPSERTVRVEVRLASHSSITVEGGEEHSNRFGLYHFEHDAEGTRISTGLQENDPCIASWKGNTVYLLGLEETIEVLCLFSRLGSEQYLTIGPGQSLTVRPAVLPRRFFDEAFDALVAFKDEHPEAHRGSLYALIGEEQGHPQWIRLKVLNVRLEDAFDKSTWEFPVRSGAKHRLAMYFVGGTQMVEFVAR